MQFAKGARKGFVVHTFTPDDVRLIRAKTKKSQAEFARVFQIPVRALQKWETGQGKPTGAAATLLRVIDAIRAWWRRRWRRRADRVSADLIAQIEKAFPTHPMPETTLRQSALSDQGMAREIPDEEWEAAARLDRDVPWTALSDDELIACEDGVAHLWGPGLAYYMGALLRFAVRHLHASSLSREWRLVHAVLFLMTKCYQERREFERHWAWFNADQIEAVRGFLDQVAARSDRFRSDAQRALDRNWRAARPVEPDFCPVCAYALPLPPQGDSPRTDVCPCCGIRFGIDDMAGGYLVRGTIYSEWRARWLNAGTPWMSHDVAMPDGWTPAAQLDRLRSTSSK